jgi:hypothetical protein
MLVPAMIAVAVALEKFGRQIRLRLTNSAALD